jgi:3-methylornithyl-N6-L-lysine dehydrogenase
VTRLTTWDIQDISRELPAYDTSLIEKTGCSLGQIACLAMQANQKDIQASMQAVQVGVIPITSGGGVLDGFCQAVSAIVRHLGCKAFVTRNQDASGIAEAIERNARVLMFADEDRFIALDLHHRRLVDNAMATARGFVTGLALMSGNIKEQRVLVLGCGPVGQNAIKALLKNDCRVSVYDVDPGAYDMLSAASGRATDDKVQFMNDLEQALCNHDLIVDATPAADLIPARHIRPKTIVSAPGMPLGLDRAAKNAIGNRLLHDPLQMGVATMLVGALR